MRERCGGLPSVYDLPTSEATDRRAFGRATQFNLCCRGRQPVVVGEKALRFVRERALNAAVHLPACTQVGPDIRLQEQTAVFIEHVREHPRGYHRKISPGGLVVAGGDQARKAVGEPLCEVHVDVFTAAIRKSCVDDAPLVPHLVGGLDSCDSIVLDGSTPITHHTVSDKDDSDLCDFAFDDSF